MSGAARFVLPYQTVISPSFGIPGAKLYFYASGTSAPQNTYSNAGLTIANPNPVVADAGGRFANIFLLSLAYKVVLTDALDAEIWTADPVQVTGAGTFPANLRSVSGNTTVLASDGVIEVDCTGGPITITYPLGLGSVTAVQLVTIVKVDQTVNAVIIKDDGSATERGRIDSPAVNASMASAIVYSNGAALRIV
jgi:hypothetical protein